MSVISSILIIAGALVILVAALGVVRLPDVYSRLHAATKPVSLGGVTIFIAAALSLEGQQAATRILLITSFFFLTAPLSAYMIARTSYLRGLRSYKEPESVDEWGELGSGVLQEEIPGKESSGKGPSG